MDQKYKIGNPFGNSGFVVDFDVGLSKIKLWAMSIIYRVKYLGIIHNYMTNAVKHNTINTKV